VRPGAVEFLFMAAAAAAVIHHRRRQGLMGPAPRDYASPARLAAIDQELLEVKKMAKIMKKYDTNRSGKLEKNQVRQLLTDLDSSTPPNTPPTEEELNVIMQLADDKCSNNAIDLSELKTAMTAWHVYTTTRKDIEQALKKYDVSNSGKLEVDELKEYLKELNGGIEVPADEVNWVLGQADIFGDGAVNQHELVLATAAWYANVEEKKNSFRCWGMKCFSFADENERPPPTIMSHPVAKDA